MHTSIGCVFDAETFNNLRNKPSVENDPIQKGDLIEVEYSVPDTFKDLIFTSRVKTKKP